DEVGGQGDADLVRDERDDAHGRGSGGALVIDGVDLVGRQVAVGQLGARARDDGPGKPVAHEPRALEDDQAQRIGDLHRVGEVERAVERDGTLAAGGGAGGGG